MYLVHKPTSIAILLAKNSTVWASHLTGNQLDKLFSAIEELTGTTNSTDYVIEYENDHSFKWSEAKKIPDGLLVLI